MKFTVHKSIELDKKRAASFKYAKYQIVNGNTIPIGELDVLQKGQEIKISSTEVEIKSKGRWIGNECLISDYTGRTVGELKIYGSRNGTYWKYNPVPVGTVYIDNKEFNFRRIEPERVPKRRKSVERIKFELVNVKGGEKAELIIEISKPNWIKPDHYQKTAFTGQLEANFDDTAVLTAFVYLLEIALVDQDSKND